MRVKVFASVILSVLSLTVSANLRTSIVDNVSYSYRLDTEGNAILTISPDSECEAKLIRDHWNEPYSKLRCAVSPKPHGRVVIPPKLDGHTVVKIGAFAFVNCGDITHIVMPETIAQIGNEAFAMCTNVLEIKLSGSVTRIDPYAFSGCTNLVSVCFPKDFALSSLEMLILFENPLEHRSPCEQEFSHKDVASVFEKINDGSLAKSIFYMSRKWGWDDLDNADEFGKCAEYMENIRSFIKRHPKRYEKSFDCQMSVINTMLCDMVIGQSNQDDSRLDAAETIMPTRHKYVDDLHDASIHSICKLLAAAYDEPLACDWLISHDLERGDVVKRIGFYKRMARHEARRAALWSDDKDPMKKNDALDKMLGNIQKIVDLGFVKQAQMLQVELEALANRSVIAQPSEDKRMVTGTGWFVAGNIVATCAHTVEGMRRIYIDSGKGDKIPVSLVAKDRANDVAILKIDSPMSNVRPLPLRLKGIRVGDKVFTVGYPLSALLGQTPKYSEGVINALSGMGGDNRFYQISVPIQPGNSGGALVDESGNVVAITSASLDSLKTATLTGSIPQNVNYAVKARYLAALLDDAGVEYGQHYANAGRKDAIERVTKATVLVVAE